MSVTTTIYSIDKKMMQKIKANNEDLAFVTGDDCEENEKWNVESFDFDSSVEVYIDIFFNAGADDSRKLINSEYADLDIYEFNHYDIWSIPPASVKKMVQELSAITSAMEDKIVNDNLIDTHEVEVMKITDRRGSALSSEQIRGYLEDVGAFKKFLHKVNEQKNYLIIIEG